MLRFGCADMSDGDFLRAFHDHEIPASRFHHGDHLRLGWLLLERLPVEDATDAACRGLRAFAHRNGAQVHFHETLTRGWMRLLAARNERTFAEFAATLEPGAHENPLHQYWSPEALGSDAARTTYVAPDRAPLPPLSPRWRSNATHLRDRRRTVPLHVDGPRTTEEKLLSQAAPVGATLEEARQSTMSSRFTWTSAFGKGSGWLLQKIVNGLALSKISPNTLTFIGLIINIIAAFFFGYARGENAHRMFLYAGLILIGAGLFDMVDGRVARQTNQVSVFGAFFDSVIDRYSDVAIFFGLLVYYARGNRFQYVVLVAFVMTASLMVSYTRARAEALIGSCKVGFMERPERIVLVILGALCDTWGVMAPALWVLAALSTVTVIHRIRFTYTETERRKLVPAR